MHEQGSAGWHKQRVGRVTGSRAGAILGLSPYQTREDVLRQMVREYHGAEDEVKDNPAFAWGRANEATATGIFEMRTGINVDKCGFFEYEDWAGASPDGLIGKDAVFECKCPFGLRKEQHPAFKCLREQPHYYAQLQMEMLCTGRDKAWFFQWAPNDNTGETAYRDENWLATAIPELKAFHAEYLSELDNPEHLEPLRVDLTGNNAAVMMLAEYHELKEARDNADERMKELLAELVKLADNKNASVGSHKLTKVHKAGAISYANVVKKHCKGVDLEPFRGKASEYWRIV